MSLFDTDIKTNINIPISTPILEKNGWKVISIGRDYSKDHNICKQIICIDRNCKKVKFDIVITYSNTQAEIEADAWWRWKDTTERAPKKYRWATAYVTEVDTHKETQWKKLSRSREIKYLNDAERMINKLLNEWNLKPYGAI